MHRKTVRDGAVLPRAACAIRIFREASGSRNVARMDERSVALDLLLVQRCALLHVGLDEELSRRRQQTSDVVEQHVAHHEAFFVTLLPPRIGEMDEDGPYGSIRNEANERDLRVIGKDASAMGEPGLPEPLIDEMRPFETNLESEDSGFGRRHAPLEDEPTSSWADLDLERPFARQKAVELDGRGPLGKARGVGVRMMRV